MAWLVAGVGAGLVLAAVVLRGRLGRAGASTVAGALVVAVAVACSGLVRQAQVRGNPVAALARDRAVVRVVGTVTSDPRPDRGPLRRQVLVRVEVHRVEGRAAAWRLATPVLVDRRRALAGPAARRHAPRLAGGSPRPTAPTWPRCWRPGGRPRWWPGPTPGGRGPTRCAGRCARRWRDVPPSSGRWCPALVDGDDGGLDPGLADDFRATGLTHLLAVSGTNLTLLVGFLLVLARWCGVRGRWLYVVGAAGIAGFVLLARTEPSVLRAAVMGAVGLLALGSDGRQRGSRALGVALVALLLVDPGLATSVGFALSVLATGGILLLAPPWRDALARWLPRWVAEAVAVPAAAQLACTPLVAAISGQVSLVAVAANLVVAPVVGPATVLGLSGRAVGLLWAPLGRLAGHAGRLVRGVDRRGRAARRRAAVGGGRLGDRGPAAGRAHARPPSPSRSRRRDVLRRPRRRACRAAGCRSWLLVRPPPPGWPPPGWLAGRPATSARATRWSWMRARGRASWWTPDRTRSRSTRCLRPARCRRRCRCSC